MKEIIKYFNSLNFSKPKVCVILGSGLSSFQTEIKNKTIVNYDKIPGFLNTSVEGHEGRFIFGTVNKIPVMCADGRFHYYEGHTFDQVGIIVKDFTGLVISILPIGIVRELFPAFDKSSLICLLLTGK